MLIILIIVVLVHVVVRVCVVLAGRRQLGLVLGRSVARVGRDLPIAFVLDEDAVQNGPGQKHDDHKQHAPRNKKIPVVGAVLIIGKEIADPVDEALILVVRRVGRVTAGAALHTAGAAVASGTVTATGAAVASCAITAAATTLHAAGAAVTAAAAAGTASAAGCITARTAVHAIPVVLAGSVFWLFAARAVSCAVSVVGAVSGVIAAACAVRAALGA